MSRLLLDELTCPRCGHRGSFHIDITATAYIEASGSCVESVYYWDANSSCTCVTCRHEDRAGTFAGIGAKSTSEPQSIDTCLGEALRTIVASCEEALDGRWDRSDDGFQDMIEIAERAIAKLAEVRP